MDAITNTVAGASFGAALTASGIWNPIKILEQMRFQGDFHMLKIFMTASSASALIMHLLSRSGCMPNKPRPASLLITGIPYDGNIIGGAMVGLGLTLTGACPGTVLVQVVTNTYPGLYTFAGGLSGGILYVLLQRYLRLAPSPEKKPAEQKPYVYQRYGVHPNVAFIAYEAMCIGVVGLATKAKPESGAGPYLPPIVGGLCIGAAQLVSLMLRKDTVGISTAYEDLAAMVHRTFLGRKDPEKQRSKGPTKAMLFSLGVMLGAAGIVRMFPQFAATQAAADLGISPLRAVLGGVVMVFGARVAGGCTSGHGISGMSMLATSSVVTVASMFAAGMALAYVLL